MQSLSLFGVQQNQVARGAVGVAEVSQPCSDPAPSFPQQARGAVYPFLSRTHLTAGFCAGTV